VTHFFSTRNLLPSVNIGKAYEIPLDTNFPLVWAWQNTQNVSWHGKNAGTLQINLPSAGGC
jgi:hypothetical protein